VVVCPEAPRSRPPALGEEGRGASDTRGVFHQAVSYPCILLLGFTTDGFVACRLGPNTRGWTGGAYILGDQHGGRTSNERIVCKLLILCSSSSPPSLVFHLLALLISHPTPPCILRLYPNTGADPVVRHLPVLGHDRREDFCSDRSLALAKFQTNLACPPGFPIRMPPLPTSPACSRLDLGESSAPS
jgi:hypothetical protein